ncbi:MAG TPA: ABC transporter ATP-binding protein [Candidatus Sulfomarinibacteraceae bacterium]|nr:ABC transporter ATP-binding protein [Candidatus Sulfomarinibacteraceae bacterium]
MTEPSVELKGVSKVFGGGRDDDRAVHALRAVDLTIERGEFFTLLGPSGCGKTTTLRLIAGFETPTGGEVFIDGKPMSTVPPHRRPVNTVFQNYALFPHMSVAGNVGYGLMVKRVPKAERERRVAEALALVQLEGMEKRKPSQLSGGQQQRVALARALVNEPALLLLDEPLGALDLKLRKAMQLELKHLQEQVGITFVYVTHDQEEALTMSDRIAVMNRGRILQVGDPVTLYEAPANRFVADFIGESNFLRGTVRSVQTGRAELAIGDDHLTVTPGHASIAPGDQVTVTVRPEKTLLATAGDGPQEGLPGVLQEQVYIGTDTRYEVLLDAGQSVVARLQNRPGRPLEQYAPGDRVRVTWHAEDARTLPD